MSTASIDQAAAALSSARRAIAAALLTLYKGMVSPLLISGIGPACRFEPTCSEYAAQAVASHGVARGGWMALKRIIRCRPGGGWGYDPVTRSNSRP